MKETIGIILMIAGIAFGLYVGLWWAFIGGIVDVISAIRATELVAMDVAIGIVKVLFAGLIGGLSGFIAIIPGYFLLNDD